MTHIDGITDADHERLTQMQEQPGPADITTLARILQLLLEHTTELTDANQSSDDG